MREEADILVLDEPTAALDAEAEHAVFERFRQLAHGRTTLLISHRFPTVRMADRILVLEQGQIVEEGTHDELMAAGRSLRAPLHAAGEGLPVSTRAVCFDLLSALLDSWTVWDRIAASLGRSELGRTWRWRYLEITATVGEYRPYLALVAQAAREVGLPGDAVERLERGWDALQPWPDVSPALTALRIPTAVATNCSLALGRRAAACVGVPFDVVVTAEEAGAYKPDPAPYRLACERLGRSPQEVAFVAGSPFDARGALACGFRVTWVNRLGAPVPADLAGIRIVPGLSGWTP